MKSIEAAVPEGHLLVSAISVWEVAMLETRRRITFAEDCGVWVRNALAPPGITSVPLEPQIAVSSTRLPIPLHGDPADRTIVATARALGATRVAADREMLAYAKAGHVQAVKV